MGTYVRDSVAVPRTWSTPNANFDHMGLTLMTLFEVSTLEGPIALRGRRVCLGGPTD